MDRETAIIFREEAEELRNRLDLIRQEIEKISKSLEQYLKMIAPAQHELLEKDVFNEEQSLELPDDRDSNEDAFGFDEDDLFHQEFDKEDDMQLSDQDEPEQEPNINRPVSDIRAPRL